MNENAIEAHGLVKRFGDHPRWTGSTSRCPGHGLRVARAERCGKTTAVRILTTVLSPTAGPQVLGPDVVREADAVRPLIGLTGQYAAGR